MSIGLYAGLSYVQLLTKFNFKNLILHSPRSIFSTSHTEFHCLFYTCSKDSISSTAPRLLGFRAKFSSHCHQCGIFWASYRDVLPGRYSWFWVCRPFLQILTLFETKKISFLSNSFGVQTGQICSYTPVIPCKTIPDSRPKLAYIREYPLVFHSYFLYISHEGIKQMVLPAIWRPTKIYI